MKAFRKKFPKPAQPDTSATAQQRRLAKIVHDDRGAASVEWREAPTGYQRPVLELEDPILARNKKVRGGLEVLHIKTGETFNPYERSPDDRRKEGTRNTDLRKLSEHIKKMRDLEKLKSGTEDEE